MSFSFRSKNWQWRMAGDTHSGVSEFCADPPVDLEDRHFDYTTDLAIAYICFLVGQRRAGKLCSGQTR